MLELAYKSSAAVPVRLTANDGTALLGVTFDAVTVTVEKSDGTFHDLALTAVDWSEAVQGAFNGSGKYTLILPAALTDVPGSLVYAVTAAGGRYVGAVSVAHRPYVTFTGGGETTVPIIVSVSAPKRDRVVVTFSEPVKMTTEADGALTVANYVISGLTVQGVTQITDSQVELTTSLQTPGQTYDLMVQNIVDLNGNVI